MLITKQIILVILFYCYVNTNGFRVENLGGVWKLSNIRKGYDLKAVVPGGIYTDLMKNNILEDIFYGFNDIRSRWVSTTDWNYSRTFDVDFDLSLYKNINLVFDGIDTFSKIIVNNVEIGQTENMFVRYIFDIKKYIQLGSNNIIVQFRSPVNVAKTLYEEQSKSYVVPPICIPSTYNGECHVNHIRKMQASFAWDWGPAFPSVGIWKEVYLEAYNSSIIHDVTVATNLNTSTNSWDVQFIVYFQGNSLSSYMQGTLFIQILTDAVKAIGKDKINIKRNKYGEFVVTQNVSIPKSHVRLWWPNGYGEARLYAVKLTYVSRNNEETVKRFRIGFRTAELVQDPIKNGRTFYFRINGIPIFSKGSNIIPISILPELSQNETTIRYLLESAKHAHMNMLRVWGGSVYESDIFYELADEMGIMIWQDFMFACSMYPTTDRFLRNVVNEVKHQVRRLQHHPSIVLWAGNNENEVALIQNWYGTWKNLSLYKEDYVKLYVHTIEKEVLLNDNTRPYLVSSPTNGIKSEEQGHIALNPQSSFYGDVHFYMYMLDSWKKRIYPVNRFASEYGFQGMPNLDTLLTATNNTKDLNISSEFLISRQHRPLGYSEITLLISYQLQLPSRTSENYYKAFIFYSQIIQAMSVKVQTEVYRQWRSDLNDKGKGFTMGALYWQLNDVWAAPSWSGIDFKGKWKMLHYYTKNFFAPIIVVGDLISESRVNVYVISDLMEKASNATITVNIQRWDSFKPLKQHIINIDVLPATSQNVKTLNLDYDPSCYGKKNTTENCFISFTVRNSSNQYIAPDNYIFPVKLKKANLLQATVTISSIRQNDTTGRQFVIEIRSTAVALFVWLDAYEIPGHFSDNGFMQVIPIKSVYFYADQSTTSEYLHNHLTVTHLLDKEYM